MAVQFCKGDESLDIEEHRGWPLEVNDNWELSSKIILLQLHERLRKNSTSTTFQLFGIWSKLESLKSSIIGCLMSWPKILKQIVILKCHLSLFNITMNHFWIRLWYATKSRLCMTTSDDQYSCWTEKMFQSTSQSQTYTKKSRSLFAGLLPIHCWWSSTACWIPIKPSHLRCMLSKWMRCAENYNACSQHWSTDGPILHNSVRLHIEQPTLQKWNIKVLPHPLYSPDLWPTNYHFFKHLDNVFQGKCFHKQQEAEKCFPSVCWILNYGFLCYRDKQTYFSLATICWL